MISAIKAHDSDVSTLTTANSSQSANSAQAQLDRFEEMFALLTKRIEQLDNKKANTSYKPRSKKKDQGSYCWTHGYLVARNHTSANCRNKKPGHQDAATRENNMGGNQDGKPAT